MCWTSQAKPIKNIAEKDIICYKVFYIRDIILEQNKIQKIYSQYIHFPYIPYKKQEHINLEIENYTTDKRIIFGYHSYGTLERAQYVVYNLLHKSNYNIIECIIPKDSEYYVNYYQEIVSSNIIVTDKILNYL